MAAIPADHKLLVDKFRDAIRDRAELNLLLETQESSDHDLYQCLLDGVDAINNQYGYETSYTITSFPSWKILRLSAMLELLTSAGILSARNTLTYNDAGGVTVQNIDTYGRYINYYNMLTAEANRAITNFKIQKNIENGYGGTFSAFGTIYGNY